MIINIKNTLKTSALLIAGGLVLMNCETEADNLGSQFFEGTSAEGKTESFDVVAFNVNNNDTIRTDASKLSQAVLGAFTESQFGGQKSSYVTQARLSAYNPNFGTNAVIDSVTLELRPLYAVDSITTNIIDEYIHTGDIAAKKVVTTYPVTKYGNNVSTMKLNVHEVLDFLGVSTDLVYSNKIVNTGVLLGTHNFKGKVSSIKVTKDSDNSELLSREARIRIPLDKDFFQNKIFSKQGQTELSDVANFIRYFKGVKISVDGDDGYLMNFYPNDTQINIYYKSDVISNGVTTAQPSTFTINLGSGNTHFSQIEYNRSGTPVAVALAQSSPQTGDAKLYAQGMGGASVGIKIPAQTIEKIREMYKKDKIAILSAKIRLYADEAWGKNYKKPSTFTTNYYNSETKSKDLSTFLKDLEVFSVIGVTDLVEGNNLTETSAYYDVTITQSLKDIIEESATNKDFILEVGAFELNARGLPFSTQSNTRAYTPNRVVLVGTDASNANRAQLKLIYSSK